MNSNSAFAAAQPFQMDLKNLEFSYWLKKVFDEIPSLLHGNDGIIFTSVKSPYIRGKCDKMWVWFQEKEWRLPLWEWLFFVGAVEMISVSWNIQELKAISFSFPYELFSTPFFLC